jgi:flagellin
MEEQTMVINHNMSAMFSNRALGVTQTSLTKDMEKLSSGEKNQPRW